MKVHNKVFMVTGGGNGLGRELVLNLLRKGCRVVAIDVNSDALEETEQLAGEDVDALKTAVADITDEAAMKNILKNIEYQYYGIDGLINNAGIIQPFRTINDTDRDTIERIIRINLMGIKANSGLDTDAGAGPEGHPEDAAFSPAKAAEMIIKAIEQNKSRLYIGKDAETMNILYRLNPDLATKLIYKKISHKM